MKIESISLGRTSLFFTAVLLAFISFSSFNVMNENVDHNFKCDKCILVEPNYNEGWVQFIITGTIDQKAEMKIEGEDKLVFSKDLVLRNDVTGVDVELNQFQSGIEYTVSVSGNDFNVQNTFTVK